MRSAQSHWSTQQLTEFVAAVCSASDECSAIRVANEEMAHALDAEVAAFVRDGRVVGSIGFPVGEVPADRLLMVASGGSDALEVPGAGRCHAISVEVEGDRDSWIVLARSGPDHFSVEEMGLVRALARVFGVTLRSVSTIDAERLQRERLRVLDEMKNSILTAVSHELRTPLTVVLGIARTLDHHGDGLPVEQRSQLLSRLRVQGEKLERLLTDLLDLDRVARGIIEPRRAPTDLGALVRRVVDESRVDEDRPVRCEIQDMVVYVDAPKVERIVENLIANAAKYTPPGTAIDVTARPEAEGVLITVADRGPGVPLHLRDAIFEPFRQGGPMRSHAPGVGIGLSLVARFAQLHGGRAWVEERPGGGAAFQVLLAGSNVRAPDRHPTVAALEL